MEPELVIYRQTLAACAYRLQEYMRDKGKDYRKPARYWQRMQRDHSANSVMMLVGIDGYGALE